MKLYPKIFWPKRSFVKSMRGIIDEKPKEKNGKKSSPPLIFFNRFI
jgi:hypothetical protein